VRTDTHTVASPSRSHAAGSAAAAPAPAPAAVAGAAWLMRKVRAPVAPQRLGEDRDQALELVQTGESRTDRVARLDEGRLLACGKHLNIYLRGGFLCAVEVCADLDQAAVCLVEHG